MLNASKKWIHHHYHIPRACWQNLILSLVNAISTGVCFFLAIYFVVNLHFDMTIVGVLMSCYGMGTIFGSYFSGKLSDRFAAQKILLSSIFFQALTFYCLTLFTTPIFLSINLFCLGVGGYGFKTTNSVLMLSHCHEDYTARTKVINISLAASNLGLGISGMMIGLLAVYGYKTIFYLASNLLFLSALYFFLTTHSFAKIEKSATQTNESFSHQINYQLFLFALVSLFFVGIIVAQLGSTYPIYVQQAFPELGVKAVSILFMVDTLIIALFQVPLSSYCQRFKPILVMGSGAFAMGIGMYLLSLTSFFSLAIISCILWTLGEMLFFPSSQSIAYENSDARKKGLGMGLFQATYAASTVVGPALGGYVYAHISPNAMWYLSLMIGIIILFFSVSFPRCASRLSRSVVNIDGN